MQRFPHIELQGVGLPCLGPGCRQGILRGLDAPSQSLQRLLDLDIAVCDEALILVVQFDGLLEGKHVLGSIVPDESFLDRIE
jgi:hypothetical protein